MDIYNLITSRHSCRQFTNEELSNDMLKQIIECGLSAPSAMNRQPWFFVVIKDGKVIKKLKDLAKSSFLNSGIEWRQNWAKKEDFNPFYAPKALILICNKQEIKNSQQDCCYAVMNMSLMAESLGLGSCIIQDICWAINKDNQEEFKIPKDYSIYLALALGFQEKQNKLKKTFDNSKFTVI